MASTPDPWPPRLLLLAVRSPGEPGNLAIHAETRQTRHIIMQQFLCSNVSTNLPMHYAETFYLQSSSLLAGDPCILSLIKGLLQELKPDKELSWLTYLSHECSVNNDTYMYVMA